MTFDEAVEEFGPIERKKKLDPYRDWIVTWLQEHPSISGAQILDWLQEKFPEIEVGESTVRRYVNEMREIYHIEKTDEPRDYEAVDEQPPGKQMQVDWGQTIQKSTQKSSMSNFCSPPGHENPPFLPIMKSRRKQLNRTLYLMVAWTLYRKAFESTGCTTHCPPFPDAEER